MTPDGSGPSSQASEPFVEPPRDEIPAISRLHVGAMEQSDDDAVWIAAGMSHVLLRTIGRRTGAEHKVALPFWFDPDGQRIVVASFAGADRHPSWYLNLADRNANPEVLVRVQSRSFFARADILEGDDYARVWALLVVDRPYYVDYQSRTERRLPVVRLVELRPA